MVEKITRQRLAETAFIHEAIPQQRAPHIVDRTFELPPALYGTMAGLFLAFIAVTGLGFASPGMIIPAAICVIFVFAFFGVPAIWTLLAPEAPAKAMTWARFRREGISALTGHNTAHEATVQVLILPTLILFWGIATVTIAALVR